MERGCPSPASLRGKIYGGGAVPRGWSCPHGGLSISRLCPASPTAASPAGEGLMPPKLRVPMSPRPRSRQNKQRELLRILVEGSGRGSGASNPTAGSSCSSQGCGRAGCAGHRPPCWPQGWQRPVAIIQPPASQKLQPHHTWGEGGEEPGGPVPAPSPGHPHPRVSPPQQCPLGAPGAGGD